MFAQAALTLVWWAALLLAPGTRRYFTPSHFSDDVLMAFWLSDLLCIVAGSVVSARWISRRDPRRFAALWFTCGALTYATLYCVAISASTGEAWLSVVVMAAAAALTVAVSLRAQ